jgi:hypothetical protein
VQLLRGPAVEYGEDDRCDPLAKVEVGTQHLARLLRSCCNISPALATFDADERIVASQRRRVSRLESRKFVVRAIAYCWQYRSPARAQ